MSILPERSLPTRMFRGTLLIVPKKFTLSTIPEFPVVSHASFEDTAAIVCQLFPLLYQKDFVSMSYTSNPFVCGINCRCEVVIRGINKPFVVDLISTIAFGLAFDPSVLIARFCANKF